MVYDLLRVHHSEHVQYGENAQRYSGCYLTYGAGRARLGCVIYFIACTILRVDESSMAQIHSLCAASARGTAVGAGRGVEAGASEERVL